MMFCHGVYNNMYILVRILYIVIVTSAREVEAFRLSVVVLVLLA